MNPDPNPNPNPNPNRNTPNNLLDTKIQRSDRVQNRYSSSGTTLLNFFYRISLTFCMGVINPFFCLCSD